jgi:hypothetical protein
MIGHRNVASLFDISMRAMQESFRPITAHRRTTNWSDGASIAPIEPL